MKRVSVGIPSHNQGMFLVDAIEALLRQSVPPDEIVVSDDRSTDETIDVLRHYDGVIRIIRPPRRLSMVAHFNYLVEHMSGDWFSVLGGDDMAEPWFVEHLKKATELAGDAVLVRGGWHVVSQAGHPVGHHGLWTTSTVTTAPQSFIEELYDCRPCLSAVLFRRSAWSAAGGFPEQLRLAFDWGLYLRLSTVGPFVTTHRKVVRFRTGYPTSKAIGRLIDKAHDERVLAMDLVPAVARELGVSGMRTIRRAAEYRLKETLHEAEAATDPVVRDAIIAELRPLATALGREQWLTDYSAGKTIPMPLRSRKLSSGVSVVNARVRDFGERIVRSSRP